jgi:hypothetical protein
MVKISKTECVVFCIIGFGILGLLFYINPELAKWYYIFSLIICTIILLGEMFIKNKDMKQTIKDDILGFISMLFILLMINPILIIFYPYGIIKGWINKVILIYKTIKGIKRLTKFSLKVLDDYKKKEIDKRSDKHEK